jgi:hypothetical protein
VWLRRSDVGTLIYKTSISKDPRLCWECDLTGDLIGEVRQCSTSQQSH